MHIKGCQAKYAHARLYKPLRHNERLPRIKIHTYKFTQTNTNTQMYATALKLGQECRSGTTQDALAQEAGIAKPMGYLNLIALVQYTI